MDAALLHPSRFLKSAEFKGKDVTLTIASIVLEELESEDNKKKTKGLVGFKETTKLLVINRTNTDCIKGMFGRETDNWIGKRVTFYPEPFFDNFTKEHTTAIRVRGSPDISAPTSVTIHLPRKKPVTVTMQKTQAGRTQAPDPELEAASIRATIAAISGDADAVWNQHKLGARLARLPTELAEELTNEFKAKRKEAAK